MQFCFLAAFLLFFATFTASSAKITNNTGVVSAIKGSKIVIVYMGQDAKTQEAMKKLSEQLSKTGKKLDKLIQLMQGKNVSKPASTCKEIYDNGLSVGNKAYLLNVESKKIPVYCHMTSAGSGACGGGGWTLVMKINGNKRTFHYNSNLWSNTAVFNLPGGQTGFDAHETKLPTYWNTPFLKICLAMKIGVQIKSIVISKQASSLYSLIADGNHRATSLGRNMWKSLIGAQASLQINCNKEGFNAESVHRSWSKARIGIIANNEKDCSNCDSRIGFGTGGAHDDSNTCGNEAIFAGDNGDKHIKTMGYILVQ